MLTHTLLFADKMPVNRKDVLKYIPQRSPIVVVHGLTAHSENSSTSEFQVEEGHLFVRDGKLLESGLMENIAQTSALRSGYHFAQQMSGNDEMKDPPIGFIGGLKNFKIHELPKVGSILRTTVTVTYQLMGMQVVESSVQSNGKTIAQCEMKIFMSKEKRD